MSKKSIDSSPISHLEDIFNVKQEGSSSQPGEISLLTEIHEQKVIMDFQWIKNNLIIGTLKQNTNNKIVYKHSLPISGIASSEDIRLYLENILSEFNHLLSVLLKSDKIVQQSHNLINQKIVGHA